MAGAIPDCRVLVPWIEAHYRKPGNEAGGCAHIVLDDDNIEDDSIDWCIGYALEQGDQACANLLQAFRLLSMTQRRKVLRLCER